MMVAEETEKSLMTNQTIRRLLELERPKVEHKRSQSTLNLHTPRKLIKIIDDN